MPVAKHIRHYLTFATAIFATTITQTSGCSSRNSRSSRNANTGYLTYALCPGLTS